MQGALESARRVAQRDKSVDALDNLTVSEVGGLKELLIRGTPIRSCPSTSRLPVPTNTAPWPQPRYSAWKSSTKILSCESSSFSLWKGVVEAILPSGSLSRGGARISVQ